MYWYDNALWYAFAGYSIPSVMREMLSAISYQQQTEWWWARYYYDISVL